MDGRLSCPTGRAGGDTGNLQILTSLCGHQHGSHSTDSCCLQDGQGASVSPSVQWVMGDLEADLGKLWHRGSARGLEGCHLCLSHMPTVPFLKEQTRFPDLNECGPGQALQPGRRDPPGEEENFPLHVTGRVHHAPRRTPGEEILWELWPLLTHPGWGRVDPGRWLIYKMR